MWTSITTWFTPSFLFILVNAVIATIAITSRFTADKSHHLHGGPVLLRSPSFLDRVKSFNFSPYNSDHNPNPGPGPGPTMLERLKSITLNRSDSVREPETAPPTAEQSPEKTHHDHSISRSKSETQTQTPATSIRRRLQKSLSEKLPWASFTTAQSETGELVSEIERRRPATARAEIGEPETQEGGGDDDDKEVDVRADDFINKFKQQLKLQRLESLLRYRDMVKGEK
ncbi:Pathogen-associated molecular patterns-induced protein A70, partial [Cucurbita argyrosperma subsp. sororia]